MLAFHFLACALPPKASNSAQLTSLFCTRDAKHDKVMQAAMHFQAVSHCIAAVRAQRRCASGQKTERPVTHTILKHKNINKKCAVLRLAHAATLHALVRLCDKPRAHLGSAYASLLQQKVANLVTTDDLNLFRPGCHAAYLPPTVGAPRLVRTKPNAADYPPRFSLRLP